MDAQSHLLANCYVQGRLHDLNGGLICLIHVLGSTGIHMPSKGILT